MYAQYAPQAGVNRLRVIQVRQRLIAERSPRELRKASKCVCRRMWARMDARPCLSEIDGPDRIDARHAHVFVGKTRALYTCSCGLGHCPRLPLQ